MPEEGTRPRSMAQTYGRLVFALHWVLAPIYIGLFAALFLLVVKFGLALMRAFRDLAGMPTGEVLVAVLKLVDLALVSNLVLMIVIGGWQSFASPFMSGYRTGQLSWLDGLKIKIVASLTVISGIDLLDTSLDIQSVAKQDAFWKTTIFLTFGITGVLLGWTDKLDTSAPEDGRGECVEGHAINTTQSSSANSDTPTFSR